MESITLAVLHEGLAQDGKGRLEVDVQTDAEFVVAQLQSFCAVEHPIRVILVPMADGEVDASRKQRLVAGSGRGWAEGVRTGDGLVVLADDTEFGRLAGPQPEQSTEASQHPAAGRLQSLLREPASRSAQELFARVCRQSKFVAMYPDSDVLAAAASAVPIWRLCSEAGRESESGESFTLRLLRRLAHWFKHDFFRWVDALTCDCGSKTENAGPLHPNAEDLKFHAMRVEAHVCKTCGNVNRFPRYNHPVKLIETRQGRCGEWANCFAAICHALGFGVRKVVDWTDHVWCEVWDESKWVHTDPCENAVGKPLMYESGWGKKLTYVFASSPTGVTVDVARRYTKDMPAVLKRRTDASEDWLWAQMRVLHAARLTAVPDEGLRRRLCILTEMERQELQGGAAAVVDGELQGRQSGDVAWRAARGELGPGKQN
eukprot:TRINITY_DN12007_c0_g1_i1.p1 TRINITY_DN12007_c0_g1~~TRINITY_DN12007_c0_g1_i1.p1  ORF type:complete len:452 (+),score=111.48 TRINITY_DN12007_c0_g1_i1:67-1356(+)